MYQRSYPDGYSIPEHYSGIAIEECSPCEDSVEEVEVHSVPTVEQAECAPCGCSGRGHSALLEKTKGFLGKLPFHLPKFEGEDFLILGVAVFLFFSKEGDRECALLLLLLLFI